MREPLLDIQDLRTTFRTDEGLVHAVDGVSLRIDPKETLGLVGESGCGKSVTALSVLRLVDEPGRVEAEAIRFDGRNLLALAPGEMRRVRGAEISMIFQEPMTSLNPVFTVGDQIIEAVTLHRHKRRAEAREMAVDMLRRVGIANPEKRVDSYPHQLSGGMKQRVMIAMALVCRSKLLIADEPTTALDVTIQAQILDLLRELQDALGMSVLLITHDMGVVAETAHRVAVMYAGRIVEMAGVKAVFDEPLHPYTRGLLACIPSAGERKETLETIKGTVPDLTQLPSGCRFRDRCPMARTLCAEKDPPLREIKPEHQSACHFAEALAT